MGGVLRKYYLQNSFLKENLVNKECEDLVSLGFLCRLFGNCTLIEIAMEMVMETAVKLEQKFYDSLYGELEAVNLMIKEKKTDLNEIRIHQIQIDEDEMVEF